MTDPRIVRLSELLVDYSTEVKKGDYVLVKAEDVCLPWIRETVAAALKRGAYVETQITDAAIEELILKHSTDEQFAHPHVAMEHVMERIDVWLSAWGSANVKNLSGIPPELSRKALAGKKKWRQSYLTRMNQGSLRWCGCQFPTQADAQEAGLSLSDYEDFVFSACLLDRENPAEEWRKVSAWQQRWTDYLDRKSVFRFAAKDTDIVVRTDRRLWEKCDGKVNMPDGELCVPPVEDSMNGRIRFSFPGIYAGKEIEDIRLEVRDGKVVEASASKGEDLLHELLRTDEDASRFGEVAIGTNYGIRRFTKNMLFDEKIGGTVHFAIGASVTKEGRNQSSLHWDMLCDMRESGRITADGELFYENGAFIESVLT